MMMSYINLDKEIRLVYSDLKKEGLKHNGIIFGGLVRDEIISTYNKSLFDDYVKSDRVNLYKMFWDKSFHPESIDRTKIPNDMDIYFNDNDEASKFIEVMKEYKKIYNGRMKIIDKENRNGLFYKLGNNFNHKKVSMVFYLGKTISFRGYRIEVKVDIIINNNQLYTDEPPFGLCDFTCNLFIMVKNSKNYDIRMSNNTGTSLDKLNYICKRRMENKIIDELILGKVEFIRNVVSRDSEYINGFRILKMLANDKFKITNLLFRDLEKTKDIEKSICDICRCDIDIDDDEKLIEILTNKHHRNIMHKKCFIQYFKNEISRKYVNQETLKIECRCPRRNSFNFSESYKYSMLYIQ